jgi:hypothetical protein
MPEPNQPTDTPEGPRCPKCQGRVKKDVQRFQGKPRGPILAIMWECRNILCRWQGYDQRA